MSTSRVCKSYMYRTARCFQARFLKVSVAGEMYTAKFKNLHFHNIKTYVSQG